MQTSRVIANIGYRGLAQVVTYSLQAATSVVLAQHLSARDYGIVGYALIFVTFLAQFNDLGFGASLVQRPELDERTVNVAFTLRVALGGVVFAVAVLTSRLVRAALGDWTVSIAMVVLSMDFVISSLSFIPSFLMVRALDYRRWIRPVIAASAARTAVACWLALRGYGYWSIVLASLASSLTQTFLFRVLERPRVRLQWDKAVARTLLKFGFPLFSSGFLVFALFNADNFIIGTVSGAVTLGYYAIAFNWGAMASSVVYEAVHSVLFPSLARIQNDRERVRKTYLRLLEQLAAFGVLVHVGLFCCAREFLVLVLGRGMVALGRTSVLFRATLLAACSEIVLLYPALRIGGISGVAIVVVVAYASQWLVYWPVVRRELKVGGAEVTRILVPSLIAGFCAWAAGATIESALPLGFPTFGLMIVAITFVFLFVHGWLSSWRWIGEWRQLYAARLKQA